MTFISGARWVDARTAELLDCEYFHVVFTGPRMVAAIALQKFTSRSFLSAPVQYNSSLEAARDQRAAPREVQPVSKLFVYNDQRDTTLRGTPLPVTDAASGLLA